LPGGFELRLRGCLGDLALLITLPASDVDERLRQRNDLTVAVSRRRWEPAAELRALLAGGH